MDSAGSPVSTDEEEKDEDEELTHDDEENRDSPESSGFSLQEVLHQQQWMYLQRFQRRPWS
jgi:hypothetical protein